MLSGLMGMASLTGIERRDEGHWAPLIRMRWPRRVVVEVSMAGLSTGMHHAFEMQGAWQGILFSVTSAGGTVARAAV